jgi:hypothetical protein
MAADELNQQPYFYRPEAKETFPVALEAQPNTA